MMLSEVKEQDGMMVAKVKEQDGIMLANVKVPSILIHQQDFLLQKPALYSWL